MGGKINTLTITAAKKKLKFNYLSMLIEMLDFLVYRSHSSGVKFLLLLLWQFCTICFILFFSFWPSWTSHLTFFWNDLFSFHECRIIEHCLRKRLLWNTSFARKICKESEYYEDMMRYLRKNLAVCVIWSLKKKKTFCWIFAYCSVQKICFCLQAYVTMPLTYSSNDTSSYIIMGWRWGNGFKTHWVHA